MASERPNATAILDRAFSGLPPDLPDKPFLTLAETAAFLGVTEGAALRMATDGTFEAYFRPGMIVVYWDDLEAAIAFAIEHANDPRPLPPRLGRREKWDELERDYASVLLTDPCCYCGEPTEHIDHIEARSRGGEHAWSNFTAACALCNSRKSAHPLLSFLLRGRP